MNGITMYPTTAQKRRIRRVDDGVHVELGDVSLKHFYPVTNISHISVSLSEMRADFNGR